MKTLAIGIIKSVLENNNHEANNNVIALYLEAFTDLDHHYDIEEVAHDNGLDFNICEKVNTNFNLRSIKL